MGIGDYVSVSVLISLSRTAVTQNFSVPMVAGYHTHWPQRIKFYSTQGIAAALVADGFSTTEATYKAALIIAEQEPAPGQIAIGRRANKPLQTITLTIGDATTGNVLGFTLVDSAGGTHAIAYTIPGASTTTTVATAVAALINAIPSVGAVIGTVTAAVAVITIARTDGALTDVQGWLTQSTLTTAVVLANTTADPGIAADLVAIQAANSIGWYALILDSNAKAEIVAAQAFIEATGQGGKVAFYDSSDSANITSATTDVFSALQTSGYQRCIIQQNDSQLLSYAGAALAGKVLALNPGSWTAAYMDPVGPPADTDQSLTDSQKFILNTASTTNPGNGGKNGNYFKVVAGNAIVYPGSCPNGQYFDNIVFLDWFQSNAQADVFNVFLGLNKVPLTDNGIGLLGDALETRANIGASPQFGGIDATQPIVLTKPKASAISPTDRAKRNVPGLGISFFLSNAIQTTEVQVQVTP